MTPGALRRPQVMIRDRTAGTTTAVPDAPSVASRRERRWLRRRLLGSRRYPERRCSSWRSTAARRSQRARSRRRSPSARPPVPSAVRAAHCPRRRCPSTAGRSPGRPARRVRPLRRCREAAMRWPTRSSRRARFPCPVGTRSSPGRRSTSRRTELASCSSPGPATAPYPAGTLRTCSCGPRPPPDRRDRPNSCRPRRRVNSVRASSTAPSISGDGGIVTYQSDSTDLAATGASSATAPFVVVADRVAGTARTSRVLASNASKPVVSTDGLSIAYDTPTDILLHGTLVDTATVSLSTAAQRDVPDRTVGVRPGAVGQRRGGGVRQHARRRAGR